MDFEPIVIAKSHMKKNDPSDTIDQIQARIMVYSITNYCNYSHLPDSVVDFFTGLDWTHVSLW